MDRVTRRRLGLGTLAMTADATLTVCARRVLGGELLGALAQAPAKVRWLLPPNAEISSGTVAWLEDLGHAVRRGAPPEGSGPVCLVSRGGDGVSVAVGGAGALSRPWERLAEPRLTPCDPTPAWADAVDRCWDEAASQVRAASKVQRAANRPASMGLYGRPPLAEVLDPALDWAGYLDALERADAAWRRRLGVSHRWLWDADRGWMARLDDLNLRVDAPLASLRSTAMDTLVGTVGIGEPAFFGGLEASTRARFRGAERNRALAHVWDAGLADARALSDTPQIAALDVLVRSMLAQDGLWYTSVSRGLMAVRPDLFPVVHARVRASYHAMGLCFLRRADTYTPGLPYRRLLEKVHATAWFRSPPPRGRRQRAVWDRRAALVAVFAFQTEEDEHPSAQE